MLFVPSTVFCFFFCSLVCSNTLHNSHERCQVYGQNHDHHLISEGPRGHLHRHSRYSWCHTKRYVVYTIHNFFRLDFGCDFLTFSQVIFRSRSTGHFRVPMSPVPRILGESSLLCTLCSSPTMDGQLVILYTHIQMH